MSQDKLGLEELLERKLLDDQSEPMHATKIGERKAGFTEKLLLPADNGHESACKTWNATGDRPPVLVIHRVTLSDFVRAIKLSLADYSSGRNMADDRN